MPSKTGKPRVSEPKRMRLAELLGALSYAIDLTEGQPEGHCMRCCWIGFHVGIEAGLSDDALWELFYTIILKDVGCTSNAARICQLFLTDDIVFKGDVKSIDGSLPQALRFVFTHTGMGKSLADRLRAIIDIARSGPDVVSDLFDDRCQTGARIVRQLRLPDAVAEGVRNLDARWDGTGPLAPISGTDIPIHARIALLAQVVDVFFISDGPEKAMEQIENRAGTWFDPSLVASFERAAGKPSFWEELGAPDINQRVFALEPDRAGSLVDEDYLDDIATAFAGVVDRKSSFTAGHSERVAIFADLIGEQLGLDMALRRRIKRAALLHDIGKLAISNSILDKPGKLDAEEWDKIRMHPVYSAEILSRVAALSDLVPVGRGHHERLDGRGYPDGLRGDAIDLDTRIVAVADVFDALSAERPYRGAMPISEALDIMRKDAGVALDQNCFDALERAMARLAADAEAA